MALIAMCTGPVLAATLEVSVPEPRVEPGDSVNVSVSISGLGELMAPSVGSFDLSLSYNPAVLELQSGTTAASIMLGDQSIGEAIVSIAAGSASIEVVNLSLLSPMQLHDRQSETVLLFSSTFTALVVGQSTFEVDLSAVGDANGAPIAIDQVITPTVISAPLIPVPTIGIFGLSLLLLLLLSMGLLHHRRAG